MAKRRPILIGCPHYQRLMPGTYECNDAGGYLLAPDGSFVLERARCGHNGGRCAQALCVLHRNNRGGRAAWFPSRIVAAPQRKKKRKTGTRGKSSAASRSSPNANLDLLC